MSTPLSGTEMMDLIDQARNAVERIQISSDPNSDVTRSSPSGATRATTAHPNTHTHRKEHTWL